MGMINAWYEVCRIFLYYQLVKLNILYDTVIYMCH